MVLYSENHIICSFYELLLLLVPGIEVSLVERKNHSTLQPLGVF